MQVRFNTEDEASPSTYRLIYRSRRVQASGSPELSDLVRDILERSREHNRLAGISGVLLFDTRSFAQVIEGPPKAVKSLFGHIACDPRHTDVTVHEHGLVTERSFGKWNMSFVTPFSQAGTGIPADLTERGSKDSERILQVLMCLLRDQFHTLSKRRSDESIEKRFMCPA